MKILCISKYSSPPKYGIGSRLFYLAAEFSDRGNDVTLISSNSNHLATYPETSQIYNFENFGNLKHTWIKTYKYGVSSSFKRLISWIDFDRKLRKLKFDEKSVPDWVIISSLSLTTILYGVHLKKKYNCKLIFEVRDIYPLTLTEELGFSKINPLVLLLSRIEKIGYKKSDLIVGTMPNLKEHVFRRLKMNKQVFYSPLGIPEIWKSEGIVDNNIDYLFPKDKIIVGYAGSMGKSNALEFFMNCIKLIEKRTNRIHFVLVGEGEKKEELRKLTLFNKNVTFGPKIQQKYIPYFLSKCNILYLSTHESNVWKYGQSMNKLIDYMMASKPIIASYSGYPSMLNEAGSGIFVPVGSIEEVVNSIMKYAEMSDEERTIIGSKGRKWIEKNHNYRFLADQYLDRIQHIVNYEKENK